MASKSIDWDEVLVTKKPKQKEIEVSFKKIDGDGFLGFGDEPGTPGGAEEDPNGCVNSIEVVSNDEWLLQSGQPHWVWVTFRSIPTEEYTVTLTFTDGTLLNSSEHYNVQTMELQISPGSWEPNEEGVTGIKVPLTLGDVTDLTDVGTDSGSYSVAITAVDGLGVDCWQSSPVTLDFGPDEQENPPEDDDGGGDPVPGDNPECDPHDCNAWVDFQAIPYSGYAVMPTYTFGTGIGQPGFAGDRVYPYPYDGYDSPTTDGEGSYGFFASYSPDRGMSAQVPSQGFEPAIEYFRAPGQRQPLSANVAGGGYPNRMPIDPDARTRKPVKSWSYKAFEDPSFTLNCGNGLSYTFTTFATTGAYNIQNHGMKKPYLITVSGQDPLSPTFKYWDNYKTSDDPSYNPPALLIDFSTGPMYSMRHAEYLTWCTLDPPEVNKVPDSGVASFMLVKGAYSFHFVNLQSGAYKTRSLINCALYMQWDFDYSQSQVKITVSKDGINPLAVTTMPKSQLKGWVEVEFTNYYGGTRLLSESIYTRVIKTVGSIQVSGKSLSFEYFSDNDGNTGTVGADAVTSFYHPYANGASDGSCPVPLLTYPFYGSSKLRDANGDDIYALCAAIADPDVSGTPNAMSVFDRQFQQYITPDYCTRIS